jgi:hypothetical protein
MVKDSVDVGLNSKGTKFFVITALTSLNYLP